jgi:hypothetical protein
MAWPSMPMLLARHNEREKEIIIDNAMYISISRDRGLYFKWGSNSISISGDFGLKPKSWGSLLASQLCQINLKLQFY